jgi:hypothetical protein
MCSQCDWDYEGEDEATDTETDDAAPWLTYTIAIGTLMGTIALTLGLLWALVVLWFSL